MCIRDRTTTDTITIKTACRDCLRISETRREGSNQDVGLPFKWFQCAVDLTRHTRKVECSPTEGHSLPHPTTSPDPIMKLCLRIPMVLTLVSSSNTYQAIFSSFLVKHFCQRDTKGHYGTRPLFSQLWHWLSVSTQWHASAARPLRISIIIIQRIRQLIRWLCTSIIAIANVQRMNDWNVIGILWCFLAPPDNTTTAYQHDYIS